MYFYLDGHPSRYQPRPTGLNFGEQTGTGVFPLMIAVQAGIDKIGIETLVRYYQKSKSDEELSRNVYRQHLIMSQ